MSDPWLVICQIGLILVHFVGFLLLTHPLWSENTYRCCSLVYTIVHCDIHHSDSKKKRWSQNGFCYIILIAKTKTPVIPVILNLFTDEIKRMNLLFYVTCFVFSFHFIHIFPYNLLRIVLLLRSFPLIQFIYSGLARSFTISNCMVRSIRMTKMIRKTKTGKLISIRLYGWIIFNAMCFDYSSLDWFHFYFLIISVIMCDWKWNS